MRNDSGPVPGVIIATDCGSTTTKAILIEKKDGVYRQTCRGEAPTTVEAPFEDVTCGVRNALAELETLSGRTLLRGGELITPAAGGAGADLYVSTSSAGGGLQMLVAGAILEMTGESARRCALGAGAIVMDVLASNDCRAPHEKIEFIRQLRPDMILLSGGTEGGSVSHVLELAQCIAAADPLPRLGRGYKLPLVFAGNSDARERVASILGEKTAFYEADNLRPSPERENLAPARRKIHEIFLEHVMRQAPGYAKLAAMARGAVLPTPAAAGIMVERFARARSANVLAADIGGATTDVFSVFGGVFNRTVSANLGMSYSAANVLAEAGAEKITRWLPFEMDESDLRDRLKNKMIRPATIAQTIEDLMIEHAVAREALRLAFEQHCRLATEIKGVGRERTIADAFAQSAAGGIVDLVKLDYIIGSGGILARAPRRAQALLMMLDAFQPAGVTALAVDSVFMMPQLGALAGVCERAALDVFYNDCLVPLGVCIAPLGSAPAGAPCLDYEMKFPGGETRRGAVPAGEIGLVPCAGPACVTLRPARRFDLGAGMGRPVCVEAERGQAGFVLDGRGRPLVLETEPPVRRRQLNRWFRALALYPEHG
ncbi:MAG: glutamate mutase L [Elusimicrobiaceae bacterium]|nr:glutamate mutase L [Elusimicrobiaceae bacterium]